MMQLSGQSDPFLGPLEQRAWTLQERFLARRFLAFMPHGITWTCSKMTMDEEGREFTGGGSYASWYPLLHGYTTRSLTFASDRTEAIKGVAEEIECYQKDRYMPEYGMWKENLVLQLLWLSDGPQFDDGKLPNIPTWGWMATKDIKMWPNDLYNRHYGTMQDAEEMSEELVITSGRDLHLIGHLSIGELTTTYVRDASTVPDLGLEKPRVYSSPQPSRNYHVITQDIHDACHQVVLGITRFDHISAASYTHVCFLAKQKRKKAEDVNVEEQIIGDVTYHIEQKPQFVYWVLLLKQVGESKFRRVGMGTLLPVAYEALQVQVQEFEII